MVRLYLLLGLLACAALILLHGQKSAPAVTARWIAAAYLVLAAILLVLGVGM